MNMQQPEMETDKEMRFELVDTRSSTSAYFKNMHSALESADKRRLRSFQLWEMPRGEARVLRFEAST